MIGRKVSHYRVLERLGGGGMGEVFKAEDLRLERRVALKFLPPELGEDPVAKERFIQEAKAASALEHQNICTLYDIDETEEGRLFIVMAFYEGETLKERMAAGPLPVDRVLEIAEQIAEGLVKAHGEGIVHRDIKPANLMITRDGVVKIVDFGLAKLAEGPALTRTGASVGTPAYMSPEQAKGEEIDHRTDLWSLGVVLWEMLAGHRPFRAKSEGEVLHAILYEDLPSIASARPGISPAVQELLDRLLAREPGERCSTAREALELVRAAKRQASTKRDGDATTLETGEKSEAPTLTWPGRSGGDLATESNGWGAWRAVLVGGLVLLALVGVVLAGWWWLGGSGGADAVAPAESRRVQSRPEDASTEASVPGEGAMGGSEVATSDRKRIVVLPFENLGPPEHEYFAAGMTQEITSRLAKVGELAVISRNTARQYEHTDKTTGEIGDELDVGYVLEGSVRWAPTEDGPGRVRISPQLIRASDDTHLWADGYDATLDDVFAVQSEIARRVTGELEVALTARERQAVGSRPTESLAAYHAYLKGQHHSERVVGSAEDAEAAVASFERAVELDPSFALGWAGLATARAWLFHGGVDRSPAVCEGAARAAERAVTLNPGLTEAQLAEAHYYYWCERAYESALEWVEKARAGAPSSAEIVSLQAYIQRRQGLWRASTANLEMAAELDPRSPALATQLASTYSHLGRSREAVAMADRAIALDPGRSGPYQWKAWVVAMRSGDPLKAERILGRPGLSSDGALSYRVTWLRIAGENVRALELSEEIDGNFSYIANFHHPVSVARGQLLEAMGLESEAAEAYREALAALTTDLDESLRDPNIHAALALAHTGLGHREEAIRHGERSVELMPVGKDALMGPVYLAVLAEIYARLGEIAPACSTIERTLSVPSQFSFHWFEQHPAFALLEEESCFREIRERHPPPTSRDET